MACDRSDGDVLIPEVEVDHSVTSATNVPSESSTSLDSRLSCARRMQSGWWQYSNTPSRLRSHLSRAKTNSAQSGRVWRFAPGRFSMRPEEHTRSAHGWFQRLNIVRWHRDKI